MALFRAGQAAAVRGVPLASGAKAILMDSGRAADPDRYRLFVMSAERKVDYKVLAVTVGGCVVPLM